MSDHPYRPAYHFTPARNWMNDPNGLVQHNGVYHLYFQYNPDGDLWGNMNWGHASSPDLVHWSEHPIAIAQDDLEEIYSGSVVVDHANSSGFGFGEDPPLVAIYTSVYGDGLQAQSLAFSTDAGMTWTKYAGNPVLDRSSNAFRDPKVSWYRPAEGPGYWVMAAVEAESRQVVFYRSDDLKRWSHLSTFGPFDSFEQAWECPDLFALPVDGDPHQTKWVLIVSVMPDRQIVGSATRYFVGDFDGTTFTATSPEGFRLLDFGPDLYASVTFDNAPDGRRILIGWMSNWNYARTVPTFPWRGSMSLPRELTLATVDGVVTLMQKPVGELRALEQTTDGLSIETFDLDGIQEFEGGPHYRLDVGLEPVGANQFGLDLVVGADHRTRLRYDVSSGSLSLDRTRSGETDFAPSFASVNVAHVPLINGAIHLQVYVDRTSVEVFAQGGAVCLTAQIFPKEGGCGVVLGSFGGTTRVRTFEWIPLTDARAAARGVQPHPSSGAATTEVQ
jgi:sucrose-6-phosphate hydrolase SacC (GH32 family)